MDGDALAALFAAYSANSYRPGVSSPTAEVELMSVDAAVAAQGNEQGDEAVRVLVSHLRALAAESAECLRKFVEIENTSQHAGQQARFGQGLAKLKDADALCAKLATGLLEGVLAELGSAWPFWQRMHEAEFHFQARDFAACLGILEPLTSDGTGCALYHLRVAQCMWELQGLANSPAVQQLLATPPLETVATGAPPAVYSQRIASRWHQLLEGVLRTWGLRKVCDELVRALVAAGPAIFGGEDEVFFEFTCRLLPPPRGITSWHADLDWQRLSRKLGTGIGQLGSAHGSLAKMIKAKLGELPAAEPPRTSSGSMEM